MCVYKCDACGHQFDNQDDDLTGAPCALCSEGDLVLVSSAPATTMEDGEDDFWDEEVWIDEEVDGLDENDLI